MPSKTIITMPEGSERRAAARLTGRYLMSYVPQSHARITMKLSSAGFAPARAVSVESSGVHPLPHGAHMAMESIGVAVIDPTSASMAALEAFAAQDADVTAMVPERIVHAIDAVPDYVRGWRDATLALSDRVLGSDTPRQTQAEAATAAATWGLIATRVIDSRRSGTGINLAVLDTGLDLSHPDFAGRRIVTQNFVGDDAPFHDGVGHGTHCMGTAGGPLQPARGQRYGIAWQANLFAGRVLDDNGRGGDANILQGIDWALAQGCSVVSLSLGAPWLSGDPAFNPVYENAARNALAKGCLLVVAAGNDFGQPGLAGAVGTPGNSPSVLTVAALDAGLATAYFSNRMTALAPGVKGPDCAGPGVDVYSAWPVAAGSYNTISGTSMATPHVAGIAALLAESDPALRGQALKDATIRLCKLLADATARKGEIGAGLVQAP